MCLGNQRLNSRMSTLIDVWCGNNWILISTHSLWIYLHFSADSQQAENSSSINVWKFSPPKMINRKICARDLLSFSCHSGFSCSSSTRLSSRDHNVNPYDNYLVWNSRVRVACTTQNYRDWLSSELVHHQLASSFIKLKFCLFYGFALWGFQPFQDVDLELSFCFLSHVTID